MFIETIRNKEKLTVNSQWPLLGDLGGLVSGPHASVLDSASP